MDYRLSIKGGTVIDGAGALAHVADVRIARERIAETGPNLPAARRERRRDVTGCYVTPGFVEMHYPRDGGVWWTPKRGFDRATPGRALRDGLAARPTAG